MTAKFRVHSTFVRSSDRNTVLCGIITKGSVRIGMTVKVEVHPQLFFVADILSVEGILDTSGKSDVGLIIETPDDDIRNLWKELPAVGEEIQIE